MQLDIRPYRPDDEEQWLRCWALAAIHSHAWYLLYQSKPEYELDSIELVAELDGAIVGLLDIEIESEPGELCLKSNERGGFPWEFSVHPDYWSRGIGTALLERGRSELRKRGVHRMEFWSMDARSQEWYRRAGMQEIERHYQFMFGPDGEGFSNLSDTGATLRFAHARCSMEDWPRVEARLHVLYRPPFEPHVTIGYEDRF